MHKNIRCVVSYDPLRRNPWHFSTAPRMKWVTFRNCKYVLLKKCVCCLHRRVSGQIWFPVRDWCPSAISTPTHVIYICEASTKKFFFYFLGTWHMVRSWLAIIRPCVVSTHEIVTISAKPKAPFAFSSIHVVVHFIGLCQIGVAF